MHLAVVRLRGAAADEARRAELEERFAIRSAEDVTRELGNMKGALMKAGQLLSFVVEGLPEQAQATLAALQADAPPMAPSLAEGVLRESLGEQAEKLFLEWDPVPVAAASIGQVHRAVTRSGERVAVKVQYPGVGAAIRGDLRNAAVLYRMFSALALRSLDVEGLVDELRARMLEELDYGLEARRQAEFHRRYAGHPFVHVPAVIPELSAERVLTSEWVDGMTFAAFEAGTDEQLRQTVGEVLFRFYQGAIYRGRVFNGDPHPGNYRVHADGRVSFLDFGLVKSWTQAETDELWPVIDPLLCGDVDATVERMVQAGFLRADHGLDPKRVWEYVSTPYRPFMVDEFTFSREFTRTALRSIIDVNGPYADVMNKLNMPTTFVILDRVVWGMCAILGRLGATNRWRDILAEYRVDGPPATPLGDAEAHWWRERGRRQWSADASPPGQI
ncbi:MAG: AarF/ABC1/UbiB kinase family protein [Acidimicrobiales bacterium]|nr:AarF/ABC1/UbiB kinase family protein [Acidimicrobiales bacterium]